MDNNSEEIQTVRKLLSETFKNVQETSACHLKCALKLKTAGEKNVEVFTGSFRSCLWYILKQDKKKNQFMDRIIDFVALFCVQFQRQIDSTDNHPILEDIFEFLLEVSECNIDSVRYWSCRLINQIFDQIQELDDELCEKIKEKMLLRIQDPRAMIVYEAIISLHRLQDPNDPEDPIINALAGCLTHFNSKIREHSVSKIALTRKTTAIVLTAVRDVNFNVRIAAYKRIAKLVRFLKIGQRRDVLLNGFFDSEQRVKTVISSQLIPNWLELLNGDVLELLKAFRYDACDKDIVINVFLSENILSIIFKNWSIEEIFEHIGLNSNERCIKYEQLNFESVIYWRLAVDYLYQSEHCDEVAEAMLPQLVDFCAYIQGYFKYSCEKSDEIYDIEHNFIVQELFTITKTYDLLDPASRNCLKALCSATLSKETLNFDAVRAIVENLEIIIANRDSCSIFICEIISNIVYGLDEINNETQQIEAENQRHDSIVSLKSEIMELQMRQEEVIKNSDFEQANSLKIEISSKLSDLAKLQKPVEEEAVEDLQIKTDIATIMRYLTVAEALLYSPKITQMTPALTTLYSEVILKMLTHSDYGVKEKAFRCYIMCCLACKNIARAGIHILSTPIFAYNDGQEVDIDLLITCINGVVDLLQMFGTSFIANPNNDEALTALSTSRSEEVTKVFVGGTSFTDIMKAFTSFLDVDDFRVQVAAAKAICRLLTTNRFKSVALISRLVIKWANPAIDEEIASTLRHIIGETLKIVPLLPNCETYFDEVVTLTLKTIINAPAESPLRDISVEEIGKFFLALIAMSPKASEIRGTLAIQICIMMQDKPRDKANQFFSKFLLGIPLSSENKGVVADLIKVCDELRDAITDRTTKNNIIKFNAALTQLNAQDLSIIEE